MEVTAHRRRADTSMAPSSSSASAATGTMGLASKDSRDYVKAELLETETNYVEALKMLKKKIRPLSTVLGEERCLIIFFGIKELSEIHSGFLSDLNRFLQGQTQSQQHRSIGDLFHHWREKFIIYGDYCANLSHAQGLIEELCKDQEIAGEITRCEQDVSNGRFKLRDLLSVPMQRILKYHLLLKKLLDSTKIELHGYDEYKQIERSYNIMSDIAEYTNEIKRDSETLAIIKHIENCIYDLRMPDGWELKDYGRLLIDGELRIKSHDDQRVKGIYIFIFDKVMLMCKCMRGDQYSYQNSLCLQEYHVEPADTKKYYAFNLVHHQEKNVYTLLASTDLERRRWIKAIEDALSNISPLTTTSPSPNSHVFTMHTSYPGQSCVQCKKLLKGLFYQGYRCLCCEMVVHRECINSSLCITNASAPVLPQRPASGEQTSPTTDGVHNDGNLGLNVYSWYVGDLGRDEAAELLSAEDDGTFLVRERVTGKTGGGAGGGDGAAAAAAGAGRSYAISLKWSSSIKHMKILQENELFYLSELRYFKSIVELIHWYSHNTLAESFRCFGLDACLKVPLGGG